MTDDTTAVPADSLSALEQLLPDLDLGKERGTTDLAAWFLGPKGENVPLFADLIEEAIRAHAADRRELYPKDPVYVTDDMKQTDGYDQSVNKMREAFGKLLNRLRGSQPAFSYRYQAHMNWDVTLPGMLGYFAAMLYNQNNVAVEASPVTTMLEVAVGDDLCRMLGYPVDVPGKEPRPWGHIACDGTVANIEAMWAARNLKYYPIAVARAIANEGALAKARDIEVIDGTGQPRKLLKLTDWALVNLPMDAVLKIPEAILSYNIARADLARINAYTLQEVGFERFHRDMLDQRIGPPAVLVPSVMHYSWPKAASLLGLGQDNLLTVEVDLDARAKVGHRKEILSRCKKELRPVVLDVAVLGSTELSSVDPLAAMLDLRDRHEKDNFYYPVHVDAAWGGYFATIRRTPLQPPEVEPVADGFKRATITPDLMMSEYVNKQYRELPRADSITVDPHKAGYVPYPAGALCYRNKKQRDMVTFDAPYLSHGNIDKSVGFYGVEGSKPGAAAAGVYLSHQVISTDQTGYGRILGQSLFNSKRMYAGVVTMNLTSEPEGPPAKQVYRVVPVQWLPAEKTGGDVRGELERIWDCIVTKTNDQVINSPKARKLLAKLGSDQVIIGYAFNPYLKGRLNTDVTLANRLNREIFERLSPHPEVVACPVVPTPAQMAPMFVTRSTFAPALYGTEFVTSFARRMGLTVPDAMSIDDLPSIEYLISTTMDPWMSDTAEGDFTPKLIEILDRTVRDAIADIERDLDRSSGYGTGTAAPEHEDNTHALPAPALAG